eukprot:SAG31_NODE_1822_length_7193_cov_3.631802_2_plen_84_part_00
MLVMEYFGFLNSALEGDMAVVALLIPANCDHKDWWYRLHSTEWYILINLQTELLIAMETTLRYSVMAAVALKRKAGECRFLRI